MSENNESFSQLEMMENVKVPQNRIGVIIGKKGKNKTFIEEKTKTIIDLDSNDGIVTIKPQKTIEDPIMVWVARDIVKAIARGFSEEKAFKLLDSDYFLEIINLDNDNKTRLKQLRGRIIGENGRTRKIIEQSTMCYLSIQGKTVSIIGLLEEVPTAKKCVEMLLQGQRHATVYKFLERHRIEQKKEATKIWQEKIE